MVNIKKRGNVYQYQFEIAPVNGTRKYINKSGFKSKREAMEAGIKAYNEYYETGHSFKPSTMSYSDYLDYWLKNYCYVNLKYHTIQAYSNIIKNHIKPRLGFYRLSQIQTSTLQEVVNAIYIEKAFSKNFMHNILKVLKGSFKYANESAQFIKDNPAVKVTMPKYDEQEKDPAHIFTAEEIKMILERFRNNHAMYYAILTAYYEEKAKDMNNSNVIYNDDPNAVTKLKEKLEYLEKQRVLIKADEEHQPWQLQNIGARIRETKRRIARLENLEKIEFEDKEFVGGKVIHNREINRIQFLFDEKPNEEIRNNLKHNGFHWSRNEGAWQREFNERTIKVTNNLVKDMFEKEQPKETESFEFEDDEEEEMWC